MPEAIVIEKVWKFYGAIPALRDATLSVGEGACTALLGRNGRPRRMARKVESEIGRC
jgi:ABC-type multidrug transport system ATPase subunit